MLRRRAAPARTAPPAIESLEPSRGLGAAVSPALSASPLPRRLDPRGHGWTEFMDRVSGRKEEESGRREKDGAAKRRRRHGRRGVRVRGPRRGKRAGGSGGRSDLDRVAGRASCGEPRGHGAAAQRALEPRHILADRLPAARAGACGAMHARTPRILAPTRSARSAHRHTQPRMSACAARRQPTGGSACCRAASSCACRQPQHRSTTPATVPEHRRA